MMSEAVAHGVCRGRKVGSSLPELQQQAFGSFADAGTLIGRPASCEVTGCDSFSHAHADKTDSAVRGPTPLIFDELPNAVSPASEPKL